MQDNASVCYNDGEINTISLIQPAALVLSEGNAV